MINIEPTTENLKPIELAGSLIFDDQRRFLLIHRTHRKTVDGLGQWETVGGSPEAGETVEEAAIREALEEAGVEIELGEQLGVLNSREEDRDFNYSIFSAKIKSGVPKPTEPEKHDEVRFWMLDELRNTDQLLSANVQALLEAVSSGSIKLPQRVA